MKIDHTRIVLTGAASGIGRVLLNELSAYSAQIVAVDVDETALQTTLESIPSNRAIITPYLADLSLAARVDALFDQALAVMGGIDLFIANAGYAYYEKIETPDWDHIVKIFQLNVFSTIYTAEKMQALNADRPYKVVMTASAVGHVSLPGYAIYSATKAALHHFAEAYRFELNTPHALMLVYPIATRTNFFDTAGNKVPVPWPNQSAETVARATISGIEQDRVSVYPSGMFRLFRLLERFLPFLRKALHNWENRRFQRWLASR
ncbi:MAG: SDR family NAD(P)-dependent oxidoreductase [Anaerolineae bacterium]|nr:SDR family NAD(P)-dependent oxidoreductase [Anaerolineae bacterium]